MVISSKLKTLKSQKFLSTLIVISTFWGNSFFFSFFLVYFEFKAFFFFL